MVQGFEKEVTIQEEHIQYPTLMLMGLNRVSLGIVSDYDAGIMALISLIAILPGRVRKHFKGDMDEFSEIVAGRQYAESGTNRITREVRSRYALRVSFCLAKVTDALDAAGLLWKTKRELRGTED